MITSPPTTDFKKGTLVRPLALWSAFATVIECAKALSVVSFLNHGRLKDDRVGVEELEVDAEAIMMAVGNRDAFRNAGLILIETQIDVREAKNSDQPRVNIMPHPNATLSIHSLTNNHPGTGSTAARQPLMPALTSQTEFTWRACVVSAQH
jgi:hypothetical protein